MRVGASFEKLTHNPLRGRIAEQIQQAILTGTLREGQRLVERNLASQFSISLTAVREALIELEAQGFVTKRPNCATHVIKFSAQAADEIFAFRRVVEAHVVEEAARTASPVQLERLDTAYKALMEATFGNEMRRYLQRDLALHEEIWKASNNKYFEIALKRVVRPFFAFTFIRLDANPAFDLAEDALHHLTFVKPIKSRDPAAARIAFLRALEEWHSQTKSWLRGSKS
jgi:DNA-binding GntR family transcriptional regulator